MTSFDIPGRATAVKSSPEVRAQMSPGEPFTVARPRRMNSGTSLILVVGTAWLGLTTTVGFAQKPAPARARPAPAASPAPRPPQGALKATTSAAPSDHNAVIRRYCVGCHSDTRKTGGLSLATFDVAQRRAACGRGGEDDPQAAGGDDAAAALAAPRCGDAGRARHDARNDDRRRRRGEPESRRAHVPAPQPPGVRARGQRPARARRRRRQLAAARHEERELRQHRRRAGAVADAARGVPERRRRDQPHGGRRSQRAGHRPHLHQSRLSVAASVGSRRGRAVRHARRHGRQPRLPGRRRVRLRGAR